jgi:hypothetical protein
MNRTSEPTTTGAPTAANAPQSLVEKWVEDPMRSVIAASIGTMSTLGIVLSGIWAINVVLP